jgi:hypothetical protein
MALAGLTCAAMGFGGMALAQQQDLSAKVFQRWHALILELVRHTPTYTPPVASRSFAYVGITAYEAVASGDPRLRSLAGQLTDLAGLPERDAGEVYDEAVVLQAALSDAVGDFFSNTGPTGQRAMAAMEADLRDEFTAGLPEDVIARSEAYGEALAAHIWNWSLDDGGAVITNMGFPLDYPAAGQPADWVPTSAIRQQQMPLLPAWGENRPFALTDGTVCPLPPPPEYNEEIGSSFRAEAQEVYDVVTNLTDEQKRIARFWSDDPMLSPTPPGHWVFIALRELDAEGASIDRQVDVIARLGIAVADGFIVNWRDKYLYNLLRPVTYIRRVIDPDWTPLLITPPFPEYPSGHSTQSGAAAAVLSAQFGDPYPFTDVTHEDDGMPERSFESFWAAAEEAALSRLYGGIHFRAAIEQGLAQGQCVGAFTNTLVTRN